MGNVGGVGRDGSQGFQCMSEVSLNSTLLATRRVCWSVCGTGWIRLIQFNQRVRVCEYRLGRFMSEWEGRTRWFWGTAHWGGNKNQQEHVWLEEGFSQK